MRWIVLGLMLFASAAYAIDPVRIVKTTQTVSVGTSVTATSQFADPMVAMVSCNATCWVAVHSTNTEAIVAASASAMVRPNETIYLHVPDSHYVLFKQETSSGQAFVTGVEAVR